jgi:hypothetical protein
VLEVVMGWLIGGGVAVLIAPPAVWFFLPTLRLFGKPDFEPAPKDDASVENAIMDRMVSGGG